MRHPDDRRRERSNPEHTGGSRQLDAAQRSELGARRDGDAGASAGIPVRCAEEIDSITARRELRERAARRERLVVRVSEDAGEPMHVSQR